MHLPSAVFARLLLIAMSMSMGICSESDASWSRITGNSLSWTSGPALALPALNEPGVQHIAYKDPSVVRDKDQWNIYASRVRHQDGKTRYALAYFSCPEWKDAATAKVVPLLNDEALVCAPHVFFFRPQKTWYLFYVWNDAKTKTAGPGFSILEDIDRPETLSPPRMCFTARPTSLPTKNWLDFHLIADATHVYMFSTSNGGHFLRSQTTLEAFPFGWSDPVVVLEAPTSVIFEGSITYALTNHTGFLTIIEAIGPKGLRFYNAWTADTLDGAWKPTGSDYAKPFAGPTNTHLVAGAAPWSVHVSHGELLRASNDERMLVDPANLQFLIQGWDGTTRVPNVPLGKFNGYHEAPWQLGILTENGRDH